jgi:hypothetical protein
MAWSENELDKMLVAADFAPLKEEKDVAFYYENKNYLPLERDEGCSPELSSLASALADGEFMSTNANTVISNSSMIS